MDFDLSPAQMLAIELLTFQMRPLRSLIKTPIGGILRACDFMRFLQEGWIEYANDTVGLTRDGLEVQKALIANRQRFKQERFKVGDEVLIQHIHPYIGRSTDVLNWKGKAEHVIGGAPVEVRIYPEDFKALAAAGYSVPDFKSRSAKGVQWKVYLSTEPDEKTGWRIASVVPFLDERGYYSKQYPDDMNEFGG